MLLWTLAVASHAAGQVAAGDSASSVLVLVLFIGMAGRWTCGNRDTPPPGFVLAFAGKAMARQLLRGGVILAWFALETPVFRHVKLSSTPGNAARCAVLGLAAGCACAALWPFARVGSMHLFFASGFGLVALAVGTRVVLGHTRHHDLLGGKILWLRWVTGLLILAATTRMSADFLPAVRVSHHLYATWAWALGGFIWLAALAKYFFRHEDSAKPKTVG